MRALLVPVLLGLNGGFLAVTQSYAADPVMRVVTAAPGASLLANGDFEGGAALFQGVPMLPATLPAADGSALDYRTQDGLAVTMRGGRVASLQVEGRECAGSSPSGFLARDAAANSDLYAFRAGACPELGLKLQTECRAAADHIVVQGRLTDLRRQDRAVTLVFAVPVEAGGWRWWDDIRRSRAVAGGRDFFNTVSVRAGATGAMSLYPMAAINDQRTGLALALDMAQPALYRLGYHAGTRQLYIAYDFGLAPETQRFPGGAEFRFVLFRFDPRWGFRAAFEKLMTVFPDYFQVRVRQQGLWMPFTDVSTVQGWEDFGFRFHEGNNNVAWDDAHGILSFRYTEPMTWWMRLAPQLPRTLTEAIRVRDELARTGHGNEQRLAEVSQVAAMFDEAGQPSLLFRNEPWCNGAVWSLNPNPHLPGAGASGGTNDAPSQSVGANAATVHWNETLRRSLYGPDAKGQLDGEYLDSLEGYVTAELNFRREHFRHTTVPLTFSSDTRQPAIFKGLAVFEFTRWIAEEVHRLNKLTFANGVPYRFPFLCPCLDVMGTETDWLNQGKYRPATDAQMSLWRTMSGAKPYLLLMNTDYEAFTPDKVELYFQRSLFYGMFPGMFSHNAADNPYWQKPKWYNRDRALFKRYLPLIRRVAEAGWHPVTGALCDNDLVFVERFGPDAQGVVYLTLFNDTSSPQRATVRVDPRVLKTAGSSQVRELLSDTAFARSQEGWEVSLAPQEAKLIELR